MLKDMLSGLFVGADKKKFLEMKLDQDKVRYFLSGISSIRTIGNYFIELLQFLFSYFREETEQMKVGGEHLKQEALQDFLDEYYLLKETKKIESARVNAAHATSVRSIHNKALLIQKLILENLVDDPQFHLRGFLPSLKMIITDLEDAIKMIPPHILSGEETRRNKPYWLYVFGEPRIGKSSFFQPLIVSELVNRLGLTDSYQNLADYTYFRRVGAEYWDGYTNQLVTWYNDVFQLNSRSEEVVKTIGELTDVVDDNPCILNMANCDLKDKIYFNSKIVVSNGQNDLPEQQFLQNNCWSNGKHILARRNCVVEFVLNPKYAMSGAGADKQLLKMAIDDPKVEKMSCGGVDLIPIVS